VFLVNWLPKAAAMPTEKTTQTGRFPSHRASDAQLSEIMKLQVGRRRPCRLWSSAVLVLFVVSQLGAAAVAPATLAAAEPLSRAHPIALGVYRPSFPDDLSGLSGYEQAMGHPVSIVHWYAMWGGWKSAFSLSDLQAVNAHGSLPMITWEPWAGVANDPNWSLQQAILSGRNDAYIDTWAHGLAAYGKPVLLRFAHEMHNQPNYTWAVGVNGNTPTDYLAAWSYVRGRFQQAGATNVRWIWNPNTLGDAPASTYSPAYTSLYPGDDQVDYVGLDILNTGPEVDWGAPDWRSFSQLLTNPYTAITSVSSKPLILLEVGSTEIGGSKAQWITDALGDGLDQFPRLQAMVWFDVNKEQTWNLNSSTASLSAWQRAAAAGRFDIGAQIPS
jgi:beta-mannanase